MLGFITFNPDLAGWSAFAFWTVFVSILVTLVFTLVVLVGGLADLKFLLASLAEPREGEVQPLSTPAEITDPPLNPSSSAERE
jgi:hypothetical protein